MCSSMYLVLLGIVILGGLLSWQSQGFLVPALPILGAVSVVWYLCVWTTFRFALHNIKQTFTLL